MYILSLVSEKRYYKPFILSMFIMFIQEFSGVNYFAVYILDIFEVSNYVFTVCQKRLAQKDYFTNIFFYFSLYIQTINVLQKNCVQKGKEFYLRENYKSLHISTGKKNITQTFLVMLYYSLKF